MNKSNKKQMTDQRILLTKDMKTKKKHWWFLANANLEMFDQLKIDNTYCGFLNNFVITFW